MDLRKKKQSDRRIIKVVLKLTWTAMQFIQTTWLSWNCLLNSIKQQHDSLLACSVICFHIQSLKHALNACTNSISDRGEIDWTYQIIIRPYCLFAKVFILKRGFCKDTNWRLWFKCPIIYTTPLPYQVYPNHNLNISVLSLSLFLSIRLCAIMNYPLFSFYPCWPLLR